MNEFSILLLAFCLLCVSIFWYYLSTKVMMPKNKPGKVLFHISQGEKNMLKFCVCLPPKSASDVTTRELCVSINDGESVKKVVGGDTLHVDEFVGEHGDSVTGYLVDIDGAGNRSQPSLFSFELLDTIAPPMPGDIGLMVLEQVEPTPEPVEPEPEPTDTVDSPEDNA